MKLKRSAAMRLLSFVLLILLALSCTSLTAFAEADEGYYFENMDITMEVGSDKSVRVSETLTAQFDESSHGILREIPLESPIEVYTITDVSVSGDRYSSYYEDGNLVLKIGDPNRSIVGRHVYSIAYTLNFYGDASPDYDYLFSNLIGTAFTTEIRRATVTVVFPEGTQIEKVSLTSGEYGSTANPYASGSFKDNVLTVKLVRALPAYNGVSAEITLPEGTFAEAPVLPVDMVVNRLDVTAVSDQYGIFTVTEKYDVTLLSDNGTFIRTFDDSTRGMGNRTAWYADGLSASLEAGDGSASNNALRIYDSAHDGEIALDLSKVGASEFRMEISYKLHTDFYKKDGDSVLNYPFDYARSSAIVRFDKINFTLESEKGLKEADIQSGFHTLFDLSPAFSSRADGSSAEISLLQPLGARDTFSLLLSYDEGTFLRKGTAFDYAAPALALIVLAIAAIIFIVKKVKEKPIIRAVEYYPPDGLNPAEMGYIIDNELSASDITSLIFFWASHGHLSIEFTSKSAFKLHYVSPLDSAHRPYETVMFNKLWTYGAGGVVKSSQLEEKFYTAVNAASSSLKKLYRGKNGSVTDPVSTAVSHGAGCGAVLLIFIISALSAFAFVFNADTAFLGTLIASVLIYICSVVSRTGSRSKYKRSKRKFLRVLLTAVMAAASFAIFAGLNRNTALSPVSAIITGISLVAAPILAAHSVRLTDYGNYILGRCVGFKDFLATAEKSRLEMLLEENPNYYYDILPYAQVLGVSSIWENKFKDLVTEPPTWATSSGGFNTVMLTRSFAHTMNSSMTSVSRSLTSVPSSGGGGGGFGGGGFSGGGGGGGGGGRW